VGSGNLLQGLGGIDAPAVS